MESPQPLFGARSTSRRRDRRLISRALIGAILLLAFALGAPRPAAGQATAADERPLTAIAALVEEEIHAGRIPGAVVIVGHAGDIVFHGAFGARSTAPMRRPMREDTIFDVASLTKVIATTTAVMQLVDAGRLRLDDPVAAHWPTFAAHGKAPITVRQLLTHQSGLPPGLASNGKGSRSALARVAAQRPVAPPGGQVIYSDLNFIALGELIRRIAGQPLDRYCAEHIFAPLGMRDTRFRPPRAQRDRTAPTTRRGEVHDPTAWHMGGVAGHAGLFSTADDLARFAQMLLAGGWAASGRILSADAVALMTTLQTPGGSVRRGLGWDLDSPFAAFRPPDDTDRAYGHTGYTGTSLWIEPESGTYVIILTNRVHLAGGDVGPLRRRVAALVATTLPAAPVAHLRPAAVATGIDVLVEEEFAPLGGRRVGLITNHTGLDSRGRRTASLLRGAPDVALVRLFSPEHGLTGDREGRVDSVRDVATGLRVFSLYGAARRPTDAMLDGLDALVFDVQDAGARFYTYITTMAYAMEAAGRRGIPFYVLDRPNPIGAAIVQGPVLEDDLRSFTGYFPLPVRHGMTIGELARLFNAENHINADLRVIAMQGYRRAHWYDDTGLAWIAPSPNLRTLRTAALYPGVALIEGANISVGRGTDTPFEVVGAPWLDGAALATYLNRRAIPGVRFSPIAFRPRADPYSGQRCRGVRIALDDRAQLDAPALGIELASALHRLHPDVFRLDATIDLIGARWVVEAIRAGEDPRVTAQRWQEALRRFVALRARYLLYE